MAAAGEIGSSDGLGEESVARVESLGVFLEKSDAVGRVTWDVRNFENLIVVNFQGGGWSNEMIDVVGLERKIGIPGLEARFEGELGRIRAVGVELGAELLEFGGVLDVVVVLVGKEEVGDGELLFGEPSGDARGSVDEDISVGVGDEIAVGLGDSASEELVFHASGVRMCSMASRMSSRVTSELTKASPRARRRTKRI